MRCWPAGESSFLMLMYDRPFSEKGFAATDLAIFDAEAKKLTFVSGLPSNISSIGKTAYAKNGKVYISLHSVEYLLTQNLTHVYTYPSTVTGLLLLADLSYALSMS